MAKVLRRRFQRFIVVKEARKGPRAGCGLSSEHARPDQARGGKIGEATPLSPCGRGVGGEGSARKRLGVRQAASTPHPALRATFSRKGRRESPRSPLAGEGSGVRGRRASACKRLAAATPHPALRATFSRKGRRERGTSDMSSLVGAATPVIVIGAGVIGLA